MHGLEGEPDHRVHGLDRRDGWYLTGVLEAALVAWAPLGPGGWRRCRSRVLCQAMQKDPEWMLEPGASAALSKLPADRPVNYFVDEVDDSSSWPFVADALSWCSTNSRLALDCPHLAGA
jgi:hypothetical protein